MGKWKLRLEQVSWREEAKKRVALEAVKHVEDGFVEAESRTGLRTTKHTKHTKNR